jgi:hypothetical protein
MRTTLRMTLSTVMAIPSTIGVRASPAARSAPLVMKKIIIPPPKMNITRRKGSASARTAGAAFTRSSTTGERTYPNGAITRKESPMTVRKAW